MERTDWQQNAPKTVTSYAHRETQYQYERDIFAEDNEFYGVTAEDFDAACESTSLVGEFGSVDDMPIQSVGATIHHIYADLNYYNFNQKHYVYLNPGFLAMGFGHVELRDQPADAVGIEYELPDGTATTFANAGYPADWITGLAFTWNVEWQPHKYVYVSGGGAYELRQAAAGEFQVRGLNGGSYRFDSYDAAVHLRDYQVGADLGARPLLFSETAPDTLSVAETITVPVPHNNIHRTSGRVALAMAFADLVEHTRPDYWSGPFTWDDGTYVHGGSILVSGDPLVEVSYQEPRYRYLYPTPDYTPTVILMSVQPVNTTEYASIDAHLTQFPFQINRVSRQQFYPASTAGYEAVSNCSLGFSLTALLGGSRRGLVITPTDPAADVTVGLDTRFPVIVGQVYYPYMYASLPTHMSMASGVRFFDSSGASLGIDYGGAGWEYDIGNSYPSPNGPIYAPAGAVTASPVVTAHYSGVDLSAFGLGQFGFSEFGRGGIGIPPSWAPPVLWDTVPLGVFTFDFNFGDGTHLLGSTVPTATHRYDEPGHYTVTVTAHGDHGAIGTGTQVVEVREGQTVAAGPANLSVEYY